MPGKGEVVTDTPTLPEVEVKASKELTADDLIALMPEAIRNATPQQLQGFRDMAHQMGVGVGSGSTLTAITEAVGEARTHLATEDPDKILISKDIAEAHGLEMARDISMGQAVHLMGIVEQMACRTARHQIGNENYIDTNLAQHGDDHQKARAQRDLAENKERDARLAKVCPTAAPAP